MSEDFLNTENNLKFHYYGCCSYSRMTAKDFIMRRLLPQIYRLIRVHFDSEVNLAEKKYYIAINGAHSNFCVAYTLFWIAVVVNKQKNYIALKHFYIK